MRIVIVNNFARITGGADRYCLDVAQAMRARGHEVMFLATSDPSNLEREGAFVPTTVTRDTKAILSARRQLRAAASAFWNDRAYRAMRGLVTAFRPDVISAHKLYPQLSVSPLIAATRAQVPIVQTVHDYEFLSASPFDHTGGWIDRDETFLRFRALNSSLFAVKRVVHRRLIVRWIAVSEFVAERLRSHDIDACVVPNPAPAYNEASVPFSKRRGLVFAGRLSPEKGVTHLVRLAELLPKMDIAVAGDGPARAAIEAASLRLPNLNYLGSIDRKAIDGLFAAALAVVMPSLWQEPGALVTLEAMAKGTPLVVYRVGGIAEYVVNARAGVVVDQRPEALASACVSLVEDADAWSRFSQAGISAAAGVHSLETHCANLERVFADAASG